MAWVDRQSPEGDEIFYDHIGYFVPNLEIAGMQLEKLGFQVSDINIQYNENAAGELHPTGTSNKLAKLNLVGTHKESNLPFRRPSAQK